MELEAGEFLDVRSVNIGLAKEETSFAMVYKVGQNGELIPRDVYPDVSMAHFH